MPYQIWIYVSDDSDDKINATSTVLLPVALGPQFSKPEDAAVHMAHIAMRNGRPDIMDEALALEVTQEKRTPLTPDKAREWRRKRRLTQQRVAYILGVSRLTYGKYERGVSSSMTYNTMVRLEELVRGDGS